MILLFLLSAANNRKQAEELGWKLRRFRKSDQTELVRKETQRLLALFEEADPLLEFSPAVFQSLVRQITVYPKKFCFQLTNGLVLEERRGKNVKKSRYFPFGYSMDEGKIVILPQESELLQKLFSHYLNGASLQQLADLAAQSGLRFREDSEHWE